MTLACLASGLSAGDEVLVPNYTMVATPNSLRLFGAVPIFVDVEPQTLCIDLDLATKAITPKTKAVMLMSANGRYPRKKITEIKKFLQDFNLILIEDAAQSLGSTFPNGLHIGRLGSLEAFSFSKIISTGQGGALVTDDDGLALKARRLKDFGRSGVVTIFTTQLATTLNSQSCRPLWVGTDEKTPKRIRRKRKYTLDLSKPSIDVCNYIV